MSGKKKTIMGLSARRPLETAPGVTLVELLVVVLISVIVVGVAFTLYRVNVTYYLKEDAHLEQDQNLRAAMNTVSRDVRMAGNGFDLLGPPARLQFIQACVPHEGQSQANCQWFRYEEAGVTDQVDWGIRAVFGQDGENDGPDTLTVFRAELESGRPLGHLTSPFNFFGNLTLSGNIPNNALSGGDIIAIVGSAQPGNPGYPGDVAVLAEVQSASVNPGVGVSTVIIRNSGRFTPPSGSSLFSFQAGASVYNLRDVNFVTYYLDEKTHQLMADHYAPFRDDPDARDATRRHASVVVASNIDDFQVFYFFANDVVSLANIQNNPDPSGMDLFRALDVRTHGTGARRVKAVALGLMSRSSRPDRNAPRQPRPAFFNRAAGGVPDQHMRSMQTEIVFLRNF